MTFKNTVPCIRNAKTASACDVGNKAPKHIHKDLL